MGEQGGHPRPTLKLLPGGAQVPARPPESMLPQRHTWLILTGVTLAVLGAAAFLMAPAFSHRPPRLTEAQAAAAQAASEATPAFVSGLSDLLGLDEAETRRLEVVVADYEARRAPHQRELSEALGALRLAAGESAADVATVDRALSRLLQAQAALQALDRELTERATAGLAPSRRAQAVLLLGQFQRRLASAPGR